MQKPCRWSPVTGGVLVTCLTLLTGLEAQAGGGQDAAPALALRALEAHEGFSSPRFTPDGRALVLSGPEGDGLYVLERSSGVLTRLTGAPSAGRVTTLSPDGRLVGFKQLIPTPWGGFAQVPSIYDRTAGTVRALTEEVPVAGVPSFSPDGRLALPVGQTLYLLSQAGDVEQTFALGHDVNLTPFVDAGRAVVYNDAHDRIWRLELATGRRTPLTPEGEGFFAPQVSPDGRWLLLSHLRGDVFTVSLTTHALHSHGPGIAPRWTQEGSILFSRQERLEGRSLEAADLFRVWPQGGPATAITQTPARLEVSGALSWPEGLLALEDHDAGSVFLASLNTPLQMRRIDEDIRTRRDALLADGTRVLPALERAMPAGTVQIANVPYVHQVYDTRDDFNGNWACNATSATMCLAYYGILPAWNTTASWPYSHVSPYGNYISEVYTFNGHTYNIGSLSPADVVEYGGYGYIVQNDWEDTKGHMAEYLTYHGLGSGVDWSPSWSKLQSEVAAQKPFVVLNSLTSSGHYIVAIGYLDSQHTAVYNDPYGDKNDGYTNYYGAGVLYDWPGYNNGYQNLNTAWCFIWARGTVTPPAGSTGNLLGYVREGDIYSGKGLQATLTLSSGQSATTDASGYYKFSALPTGTYTVTVKAPCYGSSSFSKTISANTDAWGSVALTPDGSCTVPGTLSGTVLGADTGAALVGASVTLSTGAVTTSDTLGKFAFTGLAAGTYTVTAAAECYAEGGSTVGVAAGGTTSVTLTLTEEGCSSGGCGARALQSLAGPARAGVLLPSDGVLLLGLLGMRRRAVRRSHLR